MGLVFLWSCEELKPNNPDYKYNNIVVGSSYPIVNKLIVCGIVK